MATRNINKPATELFTAPAIATTGNDLKQLADRGEENPNFYSEGVFEGYVAGITDTILLNACIPKDVTNKQMVEVVRKYLKDHPKELQLHAKDLVKKAVDAAWPCK